MSPFQVFPVLFIILFNSSLGLKSDKKSSDIIAVFVKNFIIKPDNLYPSCEKLTKFFSNLRSKQKTGKDIGYDLREVYSVVDSTY